ncbi:sarcosine oxidase subunit gamma family protein [Ancylobacter sp. WKF20]|uniref:sarcosine oxidase subunit gamma n=1 Tax=Ancylobacter sp. WKF20 TaxID=3039801 RepID=UPI0024343CE5|nr:sarcosine oxidase subunit gamma family protein [Ancylobacter sp. WKF20]WGD30230.1 sarcosine oxidase subunit gamma family protein [Ancylobacter sp. WKF20]
MAELSTHDPLAGIPIDRVPPSGHYGRAGTPGATARLVEGLALATLVARKGQAPALGRRLAETFGAPVADAPRLSGTAPSFIGMGPGRWIALAEDAGLATHLREAAGPLAAVTEQSDGYIVLDLAGPKMEWLLAKGALIDLDPAVFRAGDVATTVLAHIGVTLWRTGPESFRLLVLRSYLAAFCRFLVASGAEFGLRLDVRG